MVSDENTYTLSSTCGHKHTLLPHSEYIVGTKAVSCWKPRLLLGNMAVFKLPRSTQHTSSSQSPRNYRPRLKVIKTTTLFQSEVEISLPTMLWGQPLDAHNQWSDWETPNAAGGPQGSTPCSQKLWLGHSEEVALFDFHMLVNAFCPNNNCRLSRQCLDLSKGKKPPFSLQPFPVDPKHHVPIHQPRFAGQPVKVCYRFPIRTGVLMVYYRHLC